MRPILLILPPYESQSYLKNRTPFPLGLLYIAAYLKKKGIKSKVWDLSYPPDKMQAQRPSQLKTGQSHYFRFGWPDKKISAWLERNLKKYHNIIGVSSLMSSNWTGAYRVIELIKKIKPQSKVVMGGPHATMFPDHVSRLSMTDYICIGEGENSFFQFIKSGGKESKEIFKLSNQPKYSTVTKTNFIHDMDGLPFPNRNILQDQRGTESLYITFSRGCPHKCSFCGSHLIQGRKWRSKSIDRILEELKFYNRKWGVKNFTVEDDNPCPGPKGIKHFKEVCRRIVLELPTIRLTIGHGLPVYATADKELCKLLWEAGFRDMTFPVESTDPEVLKDMQKEQVLIHWKQAIANWQKYEKWNPVQIIIGYPFKQTITKVLTTIMDIAEIKGRVWASWFRPYKGIKLFDRCVNAGYISTKNYDPINTQSFCLETKHFKIKDLRELVQIGNGVGYATGYNCNPFKEILNCKYFLDFTIPKKEGDVVARGYFNFKKHQNIAAGIMLTATGKFNGRPIVSFKDDSQTIIYKGCKPSKVYTELKYLLTGKKPKSIITLLNKEG